METAGTARVNARYTRTQVFGIVLAAVLTTAAVAWGGFALAAGPTPNKYYACAKNNAVSGGIKVNTKPTCPAGQKLVVWSQAGPRGATGVAGAKGATGAAGADAPTPTCAGFPHIEIDWSYCNLYGANLANANFASANLSRTTLLDAKLNGANLSNADLSEADIANLDLSSANLSNANLSGAAGAPVINGTTWSNTTCPDGTNSNTNVGSSCNNHFNT